MRTLIRVTMDTETSNRLVSDGTMGKLMEEILTSLKPEAAYFLPLDGRRCALFVADITDEAAVVPIVEPFWLEGKADVSLTPCLNAQDLMAGLGRLGEH